MIRLDNIHNVNQNQAVALEGYNSTQITLHNSSSEESWAKLFGAHEGKSGNSQPISFVTDGTPQTLLFNPLNQLLYVVNQLAASLEVFEQNGKLLKRIVLDESSIPTASPIAIEFNPIKEEVYILGSLSDQLYVVNNELELVQTVNLAIRPYALQFNPINQKLYVQHLVGTTVSVLDTEDDLSKTEIETNAVQVGLAINPNDGNWAVMDETSTIKIYDSSDQLKQTIEGNSETIEQMIYSNSGEELLLLDKAQKKVVGLEVEEGTIKQSLALEGTPNKIIRKEDGGYYLSIVENSSILRLNEELDIAASFDTDVSPKVWALSQEEEIFFVGDGIRSKVTVIDPKGKRKAVSYNESYDEVVSDFQYRPVMVKHLKVSYADWDHLPFMRIGYKSSAGKKESQLISLHQYRSPQHFSPIYQVTALNQKIIDGRAFWEVLIPPEQSVSLLIYHK